MSIEKIHIVDSHTGGEPTRVAIAGGPELRPGSLNEQLLQLKAEHDSFRQAVVNEPRGSEIIVGALLLEPTSSDCIASVIFFNNVGYLGMCGHGAMGVIATLAHLGRITAGVHKIETPVGIVSAELNGDETISIENVISYRTQANVKIDVPEYGIVTGDVAWGGNWFFLVEKHPFSLAHQELGELIRYTTAIRKALVKASITGEGGIEIDHIELFVPSETPDVNSKNFVLCPGLAYDRSPCGTGTSAKLACLSASGKLAAGMIWRQESFIGSIFEASYRTDGNHIIPRITGRAYVIADGNLILNSEDPFRIGIPSL